MKLHIIAILLATACTLPTEAQHASQVDNTAFDSWLPNVRETSSGIGEMYYYYYDPCAGPTMLSPSVSMQVAEYYLSIGDTSRAITIADSVLAWQDQGHTEAGSLLTGSFPTEVAYVDSTWQAQYMYSSSDSLLVADGLLDLYDATSYSRYLDAAAGVGDWLRDVMANGQTYGVWTSKLGGFMNYAVNYGAFDNTLKVGSMLYGIPTLYRLSAETSDTSYEDAGAAALGFLELGQRESGALADHYDPGYPPSDYDVADFVDYGPGQLVADDTIRGVIALAQAGNTDAVEAFLDWYQAPTDEAPGVLGYLDSSTGGSGFPMDTPPYYDLVSSGLLYDLYLRTGDYAGMTISATFLAGKQDENGGWQWGVKTDDSELTTLQATIVGLVSTVDLTPH